MALHFNKELLNVKIVWNSMIPSKAMLLYQAPLLKIYTISVRNAVNPRSIGNCSKVASSIRKRDTEYFSPFTIILIPLCSEVEEMTALVFLEEFREAVVIGDVQLVPVVQTCTFQVLVADLEAQRTDEVQSCSRNGAGSGDISRILRYLRFYKDDIEILHNYPSI